MISLVPLLSGIYPFHAMHSLLVTIMLRDDIAVINYLPMCTYHLLYQHETYAPSIALITLCSRANIT